MDENTTQKLHEVFSSFSTSPEGIDGSNFARLCRRLNFRLSCLRGISIVEKSVFDIMFARNKSHGRRRLGFNQFLNALDEIGGKFGLSIEEIILALCSLDEGKSVPDDRSTPGPSRFFYDTSTWTGTAAQRDSGPSSGRNPNRIIDLSEIVNRENSQPWVTPQRKAGRISSGASSARHRPPAVSNVSSPYGPSRFYYDKTTYTGIHKKADGDETTRVRPVHLFPEGLVEDANTAANSNFATPSANPSFMEQVMYLPPVDSYFESFLKYN